MGIWESLSQNLLKWLMGVVATLMVAGLMGGFKFYTDWRTDEAAEDKEKEIIEARMFDTPAQKENHKIHVDQAPDAIQLYKQRVKDSLFKEHVEEHLKKQDCLLIRLNDQYYQLNNKIEK